MQNKELITKNKQHNLRHEVVGVDQLVPILCGESIPYVNFDNAASTPAFKFVKQKVDEALNWYSSVHRGAGFKSLLSTRIYENCRRIVAEFVGADIDKDCVIFCVNTSAAVNMLANCMPFDEEDIILCSDMEHHSNDLPWRIKAKVIYIGTNPDGSLSVEAYKNLLERYNKRIKLVAVTGASNVSGFVNPIYEFAELAHQYGAKIFVDCAQLAPHRAVQMGKVNDPQRLDFIAISAHKMYAPFGSGALIGQKSFFAKSPPDYRGGGTIEIVTHSEVHWADPPERNEAGSPNVIGAVALAASMVKLTEIGMDKIYTHEAELTRYTLEKMKSIPDLRIFGSSDPMKVEDRLGVITFELNGITHGKIAAILSFEGGIAVRNGCFCAHPYVLSLLDISEEEFDIFKQQALTRNRSTLPGMVRVSFGCYNTFEEVDRLIEMLNKISAGDYMDDYVVDLPSGSYSPRQFRNEDLDKYFHF